MDPRNLYTLRYREGFGVQTGLVVAANSEQAEAIGKKWCNSRVNCRFIRTEPTILADESILNPATVKEEAPKVSKAEAAALAATTGGVKTKAS